MKAKLIAVLVAISALFIGVVLWRTDAFVYGDRMNWVEAQTRTQVSSLQRSLLTELESLQRVVGNFSAENFKKEKMNWNTLAPYYGAGSFSVNGNAIEAQSFFAKDNSKAASWTTEFIKNAVGSLEGKTSDLKFYVKPFQDPQGGRYVAILFLGRGHAYALFGSGENFQSLIDSQRGSLSSFSIVANNGLTVGHSVAEYLGTVMRDDPVFKDSQSSGASYGSNSYRLGKEDIYGMFESVPFSNLVVLSSAPLKDAMKGRNSLVWQFILMGLGLVAVGAAAILLFVRSEAKVSVVVPPIVPPVVHSLDPQVTQREKMQASMRVASALAHEMSGPLSSILGHTQSILAQSPGDSIVQSADSVIREARQARGILDKLLGYAGEKGIEKNSLKLEGPLLKVLKNLDTIFSVKGIKIVKNFQETRPLDLDVEGVVRALGNILQNAIESLERMPKKEISLSLYEDAEGVHLDIQDCGEGIEAQNIEKVFDPFFTTRSFQNHMGLGLSVAFGILKEHHAEVRLESQRGLGTKVKILFKPNLQNHLEAPIAKKEEVMTLDVPQLKLESEHRPAAEAVFAEVKATSPEPSPVDVNIESLLDLPDVAANEESTLSFIEESDSEKTVVLAMSEQEPLPSPPAQGKLFSERVKTSKLDSYQVEIRRPGKRL